MSPKTTVRVRARHLPPMMNFNFWVEVGNVVIANEISHLRALAKARILAKAIHGDGRKFERVDFWERGATEKS